jgi:SAM-dependent methyltransferase
MRRELLDAVVRPILWLRRKQRRRVLEQTPVKVNLGSGLSVADGWVNVDASLNALCARWPRPLLARLYRLTSVREWYSLSDYLRLLRQHAFVHHDLRYGIPFETRSIDFLYSSHCLEHLFRDEVERLLREAFRVLKPGGHFRIAVPDLERAVAVYQEGRREEALDFFFARSRSGHFNRHQYLYDFGLLRGLLFDAGFRSVERCRFREGGTPDIEQLDNRPEGTLFVEALR